jgi:hypothetical protein
LLVGGRQILNDFTCCLFPPSNPAAVWENDTWSRSFCICQEPSSETFGWFWKTLFDMNLACVCITCPLWKWMICWATKRNRACISIWSMH